MYAIIGGTGLSRLSGFSDLGTDAVATPYGEELVCLFRHQSAGGEVLFIPRHGPDHSVPPHAINYRANTWALKEAGVEGIFAINAVGGIHDRLGPGNLAIPDQIIDYTWGRDSTFFDAAGEVEHVDFSHPYDAGLREKARTAVECVLKSEEFSDRDLLCGGVFGITQGPRLETAAEIQRMVRDGCDMVGMTGMPEAALARELEIPYACLALSVNWAAGISDELISLDEINKVVEKGSVCINVILQQLLS